MRNIGNAGEKLRSLTGDKSQFSCHAVLPHRLLCFNALQCDCCSSSPTMFTILQCTANAILYDVHFQCNSTSTVLPHRQLKCLPCAAIQCNAILCDVNFQCKATSTFVHVTMQYNEILCDIICTVQCYPLLSSISLKSTMHFNATYSAFAWRCPPSSLQPCFIALQ